MARPPRRTPSSDAGGERAEAEVRRILEKARAFEAEGADALILSGGFVSKVPMYIMRGEVPFREMYRGQTSLTKKLSRSAYHSQPGVQQLT